MTPVRILSEDFLVLLFPKLKKIKKITPVAHLAVHRTSFSREPTGSLKPLDDICRLKICRDHHAWPLHPSVARQIYNRS